MAYKPPRSVAESEELLHGGNPDAEVFGFWLGLLKGTSKLALVIAAIAAVTYLCISAPVIGWAVAGGVLAYAIVEISKAGKK